MTNTDIATVAIVGRGQVGSALGRVLAAAGRTVLFGVREPAGADERSVRDACAAAQIVMLAVPWVAVETAFEEMGSLAGKIVIDCTNPFTMKDGRLGLVLGFDRSGGERVAALATGAAVFKAFNQTGAENMGSAADFAERPVMFVAGDDVKARPAVMALVEDAGFEAVDAGPLDNARLLEPLAMLWIDQVLARGQDRNFAFVRMHRRGGA